MKTFKPCGVLMRIEWHEKGFKEFVKRSKAIEFKAAMIDMDYSWMEDRVLDLSNKDIDRFDNQYMCHPQVSPTCRKIESYGRAIRGTMILPRHLMGKE